MNEEKAVQAAADLIGELFVFSVLTMSKLNMYSKTCCVFSLILVIYISYKISIFTFSNYDSASAMQAYNLSRRPDNICCAYLQVGNTVVQTRVIQPLVHRTLVHLMYFFSSNMQESI